MNENEFKYRIHSWIQNEREILEELKCGKVRPNWTGLCVIDSILNRIEFNVLDAFYDYIYPEPCLECSRTGKDHDSECSHFDDADSRGMDKYTIHSEALPLNVS